MNLPEEFFYYFILLNFAIRTLRNTFYQSFLWQLKEYRVDRILVHLKTPQGKKLIFGPITLIKWFLLIVISLSLLFWSQTTEVVFFSAYNIGHFGFWLILILEGLANIKELLTTHWRVPKLTPKMITILLVILYMQFFPLVELVNYKVNLDFLPFFDKLLAPSIALLVILFNIPSFIYKKLMIWRAERKISKLKNLIIIGITGSYGKTSTKEFLATILCEKYKVAKTPESQNTNIGIAKYIVNKLSSDHEVFVVEMGAYKRGEIKEICEMVHPKMGVVTGINEQHIELFGSQDETKKAKYELIESLPESSVAIFNGNNKHCLEMSSWAKKRKLNVLIYQTKKDLKSIKAFKDHIEFTYIQNKKKFNFQASLMGVQTIENLLAAIYTALSLRMNLDNIKSGLKKIKPPPKTMKLVKTSLNTSVIDDSFNANFDGVISAIEYMKIYKGKKILVLSPLIELGKDSSWIHKEIGKKAAKVCDLIILTNPNFEKSFYDGVLKECGNTKKVKTSSRVQALGLIKENSDKEGVVVFEGKEAGKILDQLTRPSARQAINN